MENIHTGHRERLRKRFLKYGLESFSDTEALELLLFYALPRRDTNALAHTLLNNFGGFKAVMEAELSQLAAVQGVGESAAALIKLTADLSRRYMSAQRPENLPVKSSVDAGELLLPVFAYETDEVVYALMLNGKSAVSYRQEIARGMPDKVAFSVRSVVDAALKHKAVKVIIAHNHPGGNALPSETDIKSTRQLKAALHTIGVELVDHIIVCDDDFVSLRDSGCFENG